MEDMISLFFLMILTVFVGLTIGLTPYISRKNFPFGVSLPITEETASTIKVQKKQYLVVNFGLSILLGVGILVLSLFKNFSDEMIAYLSTASMFIVLVVSLVTYIAKHKQMREFKQKLNLDTSAHQKILVDLSFREDNLIFPTSYLVALNLAFVLITVVLTVLNYNSIPEQLVTRWSLNMDPVGFTEKTWGSVLAIPAIQVFMTVTFAISNQAFLSAKQQLDRNNPEESAAKNKKFRKLSSLLNYVMSVLIQVLMMMIQFAIIFQEAISPEMVMILSIVFCIVIIGIVLWYSLRYGQAGDRLKNVDISQENQVTDNKIFDDNDDYWKLGMFYFNPKDPAFWVEKRMGVGMTFNFAKWQAWVFILGVVVVPLFIAGFMM